MGTCGPPRMNARCVPVPPVISQFRDRSRELGMTVATLGAYGAGDRARIGPPGGVPFAREEACHGYSKEASQETQGEDRGPAPDGPAKPGPVDRRPGRSPD